MFGYVTVYKDELKIKDYRRFQGYYCGLCKAIGRRCSHIARLGLSYDMTFLAILLSALSAGEPETEQCRCMAHPFHKRENVLRDPAVDYAADVSVILVYLKLLDDWQDDRSLKALAGMGLYFGAVRRARKRRSGEYAFIRECLDRLSGLERGQTGSPDDAADCFAKILERLFTPEFIEDDPRPLQWLGYNLGHWIYILDAYQDLEEDYRKNHFNPFLNEAKGDERGLPAYRSELKNTLDTALTWNLSQLASAYELLNIQKNDDILRNILYLSLKLRQDSILNQTAGTAAKPKQLRRRRKNESIRGIGRTGRKR